MKARRLFLILACLFTSLNISAEIASGTVGSGNSQCTWVIDDNGVLTIAPSKGNGTISGWDNSGTVSDTDNDSQNAPWHDYCTQIKSVKFAKNVTAAVCRRMFADCENLVSVDFTNLSVTGKNFNMMFQNCSSLESVDFSKLKTKNHKPTYICNLFNFFIICF